MTCICDQLHGRMREICDGTALVDGNPIEESTRQFYLETWRKQGLLWDPSMPSRGVGDTIKKIADATGITRVVNAISSLTGVPCGCGQRQETLNSKLPY